MYEILRKFKTYEEAEKEVGRLTEILKKNNKLTVNDIYHSNGDVSPYNCGHDLGWVVGKTPSSKMYEPNIGQRILIDVKVVPLTVQFMIVQNYASGYRILMTPSPYYIKKDNLSKDRSLVIGLLTNWDGKSLSTINTALDHLTRMRNELEAKESLANDFEQAAGHKFPQPVNDYIDYHAVMRNFFRGIFD